MKKSINKIVHIAIKPSDRDEHRFIVSIPGVGIPNFEIAAMSQNSAAIVFSEYLYNELDGKGGITDYEADRHET